MSTLRFLAIQETFNRKPLEVNEPERRSSIYGKNVFNETSMRQYLTKDSFKSVMKAIQDGTKIDRKVADHISTGMKEWAISKGATHYTHWFQPLTGSTAEKCSNGQAHVINVTFEKFHIKFVKVRQIIKVDKFECITA